jgi:hypothetical protein
MAQAPSIIQFENEFSNKGAKRKGLDVAAPTPEKQKGAHPWTPL